MMTHASVQKLDIQPSGRTHTIPAPNQNVAIVIPDNRLAKGANCSGSNGEEYGCHLNLDDFEDY